MVFDLAFAGLYGGDVDRIKNMSKEEFFKTHDYLIGTKEIKVYNQELAHYFALKKNNRNR